MLGKLQMTCVALFLTLFFNTALLSQKSLAKAERQFELKAFELSIENAKKTLDSHPDCTRCHYLIAESFRLMNRNVDASIWYKKMKEFSELPEDYYFNYGLLMKKMGEYDEAKGFFTRYESQNPTLARHFASSCEYAKAILSEPVDFELNLHAASSDATDFAASIYKNNIVFASFRSDKKRNIEKLNKSLVHHRGPQLFIVKDDTQAEFLLHDNEESYDMGPVHYAANVPIVAVTKNNFKNGEQQVFSDDMELVLYLGTTESDGSFHKLEAFPYNEVGYATGFGTLNPSGEILYFSSNRPGGYGGFDIYVSYFRNGKWTYPENLGARINTPGNEVTPFFDGEKLFFSSDYLKGLGGLDVFSAQVKNDRWQYPANMGNGINSPEDDFYFVKEASKNTCYLTSNRLGGKGSYDIYQLNRSNDENKAVVAMNYEDVVPAEVNIETDLVEDDGRQARFSAVKLEEAVSTQPESLKENLDTEEISADDTAVEEASTDGIVSEETSLAQKETSAKSPVDFNELLPPKAVDLNKFNAKAVSLAGAKRVAYGELIMTPINVYFIQLAALFKSSGNVDSFMPLTQFGSIYKLKQSRAIKVKLGYYMDEAEAKQVLAQVKKMGYSDAFITYESLNTSQLELIEVAEKVAENYTMEGFQTDATTGVNFKIRLASYEDPIWFDVESVKDLGVIEQWSKDQWTIFILSGYNSLEEAELAKIKAQKRGFEDAEIVLDRNGILERFR